LEGVPVSATIILGLLLTLFAPGARAEPVTVRFLESATHGFLVLRNDQGGAIAHGELVQAPHGEGMQSRLVFRFTDGSLYEETVTFSQKRVFRLLTYNLIQRGPAFPETTEVWFDRASGRYRARAGTDDLAEGTLEMPEDLHNGMAGMLLRNLPAGVAAAGHMYAFTPKPRLMRTSLRPEGDDRYYVGDTGRTAVRYVVNMDLVGVTGLVAAVLGKDPPDVRFWISTGETPAFLRFEGPMFQKGPRWRIELAAPRWTRDR
jgi:hypothetical protein